MHPEQFERTASQPMFGRLTAMQWLRSYYRHDRMHRDQMAGRDPEYKPRSSAEANLTSVVELRPKLRTHARSHPE